MIALLLIAAWLAQAETGTVTGTLKTESGSPAVGVRVGATARPESDKVAAEGTALASIAETDAEGRFRLENIPPGNYYITAGRVDFPTYYPGSQIMSGGKLIQVKRGETVTGIDFIMNAVAVRPPDPGLVITPTITLLLRLSVSDGTKAPAYSAKGFASLVLTRTSDGQQTAVPLTAAEINLPVPAGTSAPEYRISMLNLPDGYELGTISYASTPITNRTLRLSPINATVTVVSGTPIGGISLTSRGPNTPGSTLTVELKAPLPRSIAAGVAVSGRLPTAELRAITLSGVPGIIFADNSFEFRGVSPGRYIVATPENPVSSRPLAATVFVGNDDVSGVELSPTPLLPIEAKTPSAALPVDGHTPGWAKPGGVIRGSILDAVSREPISAGNVYLTGIYGSFRELAAKGEFEFANLLPGRYTLEVQAFAHESIRQTVVVGDDNVNLDLRAAPSP